MNGITIPRRKFQILSQPKFLANSYVDWSWTMRPRDRWRSLWRGRPFWLKLYARYSPTSNTSTSYGELKQIDTTRPRRSRQRRKFQGFPFTCQKKKKKKMQDTYQWTVPPHVDNPKKHSMKGQRRSTMVTLLTEETAPAVILMIACTLQYRPNVELLYAVNCFV